MNLNLEDYSRLSLQPAVYHSDQITITGESKVGKGATIEALLELQGNSKEVVVSAGGIMRQLAGERGMSIEVFAEYNRLHPEAGIDRMLDEMMVIEGRKNHRIIEGRLVHIFGLHSFHVLLRCDSAIRAEWRHEALVAKEENPVQSYDEIKLAIEKRDRDDNERYQVLYPNCLWPEEHYDLVVITSDGTPEENAALIIAGHLAWKEKMVARGMISYTDSL